MSSNPGLAAVRDALGMEQAKFEEEVVAVMNELYPFLFLFPLTLSFRFLFSLSIILFLFYIPFSIDLSLSIFRFPL